MELNDIDIGLTTGLPENSWATFAGYGRIGLYSNNCIFIDPANMQFYIDTSNALLFVRHTSGRLEKLLSDKDLKDGYAKITIDGTDYQTKIVDGGIIDSKIGKWHDVYAIDNITGFYK